MNDFKLNKEQEVAANCMEGIYAVIAVPGSGKTVTMTHRIGNLVKNGISPEKICGLTFTRNAAQTMRDKLELVLDDLASRVHLSTIHSFCVYLLKRERHVFDILSDKEQIIFIKDILKSLKIKELSIGMILSEISLAKNNLIDVVEFRTLYEQDTTMQKVADVFEAYDTTKAKKLLMDFDDLLIETYRVLSDQEEVRDKYRGIFQHLLVDEFQDSNPLQVEILKLLVGDRNSSFWICGDDAQSIYGFTGASVNNILNFSEMFPESEQFILNLNYRSTPQILRACQNLIRHNERQIQKELKTDNPDGEDIIILESSNETTEGLSLVNEITDLVERRGYTYKDIAILYRCNFQSLYPEEALQQHKIPYCIQNGLSFYSRREVKILLDYLRVISETDSDAGDDALKSIINAPNRYLGRKFVSELEQFASQRNIHLYQALKSMPLNIYYVKKSVREFIKFMDPLIEGADNHIPSELITLIRTSLDIDRYVTDDDIPAPDDVKIENLNQLTLASARYNNIRSFLEYTETFQDEAVSDKKEGISLMTIHKAKGLEFPVVFVIGMVENILPSKKGNLEEERRICFVAISRAMHLLYLSYSLTFLGQPAKKSIFLDEILGNVEPTT